MKTNETSVSIAQLHVTLEGDQLTKLDQLIAEQKRTNMLLDNLLGAAPLGLRATQQLEEIFVVGSTQPIAIGD